MTATSAALNGDSKTDLLKDFEQVQMGAAVSKLVAGAIGDIVMVMSKSAEHKGRALADIEWLILPAVFSGQYYVAEVAQPDTSFRAPVACVTWAHVSDDVSARLSGTQAGDLRPAPSEWMSGDHLWLIDLIGDRSALAAALQVLGETHFKEKDVFIRIRQPDGTTGVETLAALASAAGKGLAQ
ncbi:MAG: toxin-activating lysine-acyltransferase [Beijerinckiaceae bacterium]